MKEISDDLIYAIGWRLTEFLAGAKNTKNAEQLGNLRRKIAKLIINRVLQENMKEDKK